MLYSKNGSIPKPETDGTDGWIEVPEPPVAGAGEEVVWWYPPGWVVRPVMPVKEGFVYDWSQSEGKWVESALPPVLDLSFEPDVVAGTAGPADTIVMSSAASVIDLGSATGG